MKSNNVLELIRGQDIVVPSILIKNMKLLNLDYKELVFLSFLMMQNSKILFDIELFSKRLNLELPEVMGLVSSLTEKKLLEMNVIKNKSGMMCEYLSLDLLYMKLMNLTLGDIEKEKEAEHEELEKNIYSKVEQEFGRTLSPIECETIKGWIDSNIKEDLIIEALKEAVLNGVNNLKYIDKILYEWGKKGYITSSDVKKKSKKKEEEVKLFDYDWLGDND